MLVAVVVDKTVGTDQQGVVEVLEVEAVDQGHLEPLVDQELLILEEVQVAVAVLAQEALVELAGQALLYYLYLQQV